MRVASVPLSLVMKTGRLDANFYIGDEEERAVVRAEASVVNAKKRLDRARKKLELRDRLRKKNGIRP